MTRCYIALGSNLDDPRQQLAAAFDSLAELPGSRLVRRSRLYRSRAVGPGKQPDYLNAVGCVETGLDPHELLRKLQGIENRQGRQRDVRWGARTLDLDILLYGNRQIDSDWLTVPHPRMAERDFVLYPLSEIDPELVLPCGTPLASLLQRCPNTNLQPQET